jgi:hypothetical protein
MKGLTTKIQENSWENSINLFSCSSNNLPSPPKDHYSCTRKKHSCQNGLKLLPAQFFLLYRQDFPTGIVGKPVLLLLELENPAH